MTLKNIKPTPVLAETLIGLFYHTEFANRIFNLYQNFIFNQNHYPSRKTARIIFDVIAKFDSIKPSTAVLIALHIEKQVVMCQSMHKNRLDISINGDLENFESIFEKYVSNYSVDNFSISIKAAYITTNSYKEVSNYLVEMKEKYPSIHVTNLHTREHILNLFLEANNLEAIESFLQTDLIFKISSRSLFSRVCEYFYKSKQADQLVKILKNTFEKNSCFLKDDNSLDPFILKNINYLGVLNCYQEIIQILICLNDKKLHISLDIFEILLKSQKSLILLPCSSPYYSPSLITKFLDSNIIISDFIDIPAEFNIPFIELLITGKLNGEPLPDDELACKLSYLFFEYITISCVSHRDIEGLESLLRLSQLQDFGLVLDSTKTKLIPRFNKVVGSLILQSIALINVNKSVELFDDWLDAAKINNFNPEFNPLYQSKGLILLSNDIILPALIVSHSAINSGLFSIELILMITAEYQKLGEIDDKLLRYESGKEIKIERNNIKEWLGQIYFQFISSYIKKFDDKESVYTLITKAISNDCFDNELFCIFILKVSADWMGFEYSVSIFEKIILIPNINTQALLIEMMYICAAFNNFPMLMNYNNIIKSRGYVILTFKFEFEIGASWGKSRNPIGMLLNITKAVNINIDKIPEVLKSDIILMDNLMKNNVNLFEGNVLQRFFISETNIRSFRNLVSFIIHGNQQKDRHRSIHNTWVSGYLSTCIDLNQIHVAKECILIFDFNADIPIDIYYKLLALCLESNEVVFGYAICRFILNSTLRDSCPHLDFVQLAMYYFSLRTGNFFDAYYFGIQSNKHNYPESHVDFTFNSLPVDTKLDPKSYLNTDSDFPRNLIKCHPLSNLIFAKKPNVYLLLKLLISKRPIYFIETKTVYTRLMCKPNHFPFNDTVLTLKILLIYRDSLLNYFDTINYDLKLLDNGMIELIYISYELNLLREIFTWYEILPLNKRKLLLSNKISLDNIKIRIYEDIKIKNEDKIKYDILFQKLDNLLNDIKL